MFEMSPDDPVFAAHKPLTIGSMAKALAHAKDVLARGRRQDEIIAKTVEANALIKAEMLSLFKRITAIEETMAKHPDKEMTGAVAILGVPMPEFESPIDDPRIVKVFEDQNDLIRKLNVRHAAILAKLDEPMPPKTAGPFAKIENAPNGTRIADEGGRVEPGRDSSGRCNDRRREDRRDDPSPARNPRRNRASARRPAKDKAMAALDRVVTDFARGVREKCGRNEAQAEPIGDFRQLIATFPKATPRQRSASLRPTFAQSRANRKQQSNDSTFSTPTSTPSRSAASHIRRTPRAPSTSLRASPRSLRMVPGAFIAPRVAPAPQAPLPFNPVFNFNGGLTLANDVNGRILALELAHFGRLNTFGDMPFVDSAGDAAVLTAAECRALSAEYRARLIASI